MSRLAPPRLAEWVLRLILRTPDREYILGDLEQQYHERRVAGARARLWYWSQLFRALPTMARRFAAQQPPSGGPKLRHEPVRERAQRSMGWGGMMGNVLQDLRFALRSLWRRPGFAVITVTTLALGIGANTAIFSVVNGVLLSPLPYAQPEAIVTIGAPGAMSYPDIVDLESEVPSLATLVGITTPPRTLTGLGEPEIIGVTQVTKGLMATFLVSPLLGRDIRADEFGPDGPRVIVLGYSFWQTRFGGDPDVLGRSVTLNGIGYEVVGVAPEGFVPTSQLWTPSRLDPETCPRSCHTMPTIGRLAEGATIEGLRNDALTLALNLEVAYPNSNTGKRFVVRSLQDTVVGGVRRGLWLVLGAVGIVLLIACANVANLLLVRASTRTGEVAVRSALGASRRRLVAQVMTESGLIALFGGIGGLALAWFGTILLPRFSAGSIPRIDEIGIDGTVLLFTAGTVLLVTLIFGVAPAAGLTRTPLRSGLGTGSQRSGAGRDSGRSRSLLLGAEVALSAVLLVGAGLLLRSFTQLNAVDLGYETREILRFNLNPQLGDIDEIRIFYRTLEERIRAIPGVEAAGSVFGSPLSGAAFVGPVYIDGRPEPTPSERTMTAIRPVGPQWMETMRIPVLRGRGLTETDDYDAQPPGALVSETFVRENFPNEEPIGQSIRVPWDMGHGASAWRVVGVVRDIRAQAIELESDARIYVPHGQWGPANMTVTVRGVPGAAPLLPAIRQEVRRMNPNLPLSEVGTMEDAVRQQVAPTRFYLVLVGLFAGLAAVLAAIGLYGVITYAVSRRTREIGLRVALGARREGIMRLVVGQGMRPAIVGLGVGLGAAFYGGRVMETLLFGVQPRDPLIFGATGALLVVVALAATTLPAYRASQVDPVRALRAD